MKKRRVKILFLDHTPFVGGAQLSLIAHLKEINQDNFDFFVACSKEADANGLSKYYDDFNFKYYFIPFERLKSLRFSSLLKFLRSVKTTIFIIKKEKIDLVFGNTVRAAMVATLASFLSRKKVIWFIQDVTFPKILFRFFYFFTDKVLYVSNYIANYYSVQRSGKDEVVHVWRDEIKYDEGESSRLFEKWGCDKDTFVIGSVGRLVEDKGVHVLIDAVKKIILNNKDKKIKCIIVGSGENQEGNYETYLKEKIKGNKLEEYFIFEGFNKNIFSVLHTFDVFCQPSIAPEGLPTVIIEAMLARVPVVATDVGGTREVIGDNKTGLLVKPNDSDGLFEAIKTIMMKKFFDETIISQAYENVKNNFSISNKTRKLENIYLKLIKK